MKNHLEGVYIREAPTVPPEILGDNWSRSMIGENRQLVTDEPVEFEK